MSKYEWAASITALVGSIVSVASAGTNTWTLTGPNAANVSVEYSRQAGVAYARGGDSLWRTSDSGATWVMKRSGNSYEFAFAVDPTDANLVLMQGESYGLLLRSTDGGDNFSSASYFNAAKLKFGGPNNRLYAISSYNPSAAHVHYSENNGSSWTSTTNNGLPPPPVSGIIPTPREIAAHPLDANILYLAYQHADHQGIYKTIDGGATWTPGTGLAGVAVNAIVINPATPAQLFIGTDRGVYVSYDNGNNWAPVPDPNGTGVATVPISALAFDRANPNILYAGGERRGELFRSDNLGTSWQRRDSGIVATRVNSISPHDSTSGDVLVGTSHTVYRTTNSGQNWSASANGIRSANVSVLHNGSSLRAGLFDGGIYESLDGNTWTPINNAALRDSQRDGVFGEIKSIADSGKLFAIMNGDMLTSTDGGNSWQRSASFNSLHNGSSGGFITESGSDRIHYATSYSGVDKSHDNGVTWSLFSYGLPNPPLTTKIVSNSDSTALYVGTFNQGIYKSVDMGGLWTPVNNGLTTPNSLVIRTLAYDQVNDVLVVGSNDGVYVSRNGGASYTPLTSPMPGNQLSIGALLVEDFDHGAIYIGTLGRVFRSVDQGVTWTELTAGAVVSQPFTSVQDLMGDGPGVIYAGFVYAGMRVFTVSPDIRLTTTAPAAGNYSVGTQLPWSVTVTNDGPHAATFSNFTWSLPGNVSVSNPGTSLGSCAVSSARVLSCDLGVMQPAQTATINMTITGVAGGTVNIDASAGAAEIDSQPNNNRFTNSGVRFVEQVDVAVTLDAAATTVDSGATVTYTLTVRNNGPNAVTGASFETAFDARDQYALTQGSLAGCTGNVAGTLTCPLAALPSGASRAWTWDVTAVPSGARAPGALIRVNNDNSTDTNPANNSAADGLTVIAVNDMSLTLLGSFANVSRGQQVNYTLTATNLGLIPAPGVTTTLTLPAALQYQSSTGSCSASGNLVTCDLGALNPGALGSVTVTLNALNAGATNVSVLVASANPDRNAANNTASAALDIAPVGNLGVTLVGSASTVQTSVAFSYTLTVSNAAGSDAATATARVTLSNLLSYTSASGATCTANAGVVTCTVGPLAAGASSAVTLNVSGTTAGSAASSAEVASSILESDTTNNSVNAAAVTITNPPPPPTPPAPPSRGGGGGGGAFDYLSACLLAGLLAMAVSARRRREVAASRTRIWRK